MRNARWPLLGLAVIVGLASCAQPGGTDESESVAVPVLVTTDIWADVVANVGCDDLGPVEPLIPAGADPHGYRPSVQDAESMSEAPLIIANGGDLEEALEPLLEDAEGSGTTILRLADQVGGTSPDPHIWLDPTVTVAAIDVIAAALTETGFDSAAVDECAIAYRAEIESLDADLAAKVGSLEPGRRKLVTNHDAMSRFADRYGFEVTGTVLPSTSTMAQANPADLDELADLVSAQGVPAIFTEGGHHGEDAQSLAERLDVEIVELRTDALGPPGSGYETYIELMRTNTERIVAALSGPDPAAADAVDERDD